MKVRTLLSQSNNWNANRGFKAQKFHFWWTGRRLVDMLSIWGYLQYGKLHWTQFSQTFVYHIASLNGSLSGSYCPSIFIMGFRGCFENARYRHQSSLKMYIMLTSAICWVRMCSTSNHCKNNGWTFVDNWDCFYSRNIMLAKGGVHFLWRQNCFIASLEHDIKTYQFLLGGLEESKNGESMRVLKIISNYVPVIANLSVILQLAYTAMTTRTSYQWNIRYHCKHWDMNGVTQFKFLNIVCIKMAQFIQCRQAC